MMAVGIHRGRRTDPLIKARQTIPLAADFGEVSLRSDPGLWS